MKLKQQEKSSSFLEEYKALDNAGDPAASAKAKAQLMGTWLALKPGELFTELRTNQPIFFAPGSVIVTKYRDVAEILSQDNVFSVTPYTPKMDSLLGSFFLGMANTPQYEREKSIMRLTARRDDLENINDFIETCADNLIADAAPTGKMDIVPQLTRLIPTRLIEYYFGISLPDEATMMRWMRTIFHHVFANLTNDPAVKISAEKSAQEMGPYLDDLIARRKKEIAGGDTSGDDVLSRLIRLQANPDMSLDNDGIRRNLSGLIVGSVDTTSRAIAHVIDQLLNRPEELAKAQAAALSNDDELLAKYVFEALRFNPQNAFLYRLSEKPYTLARGTERETEIPAGSFVIAATLSAMFDEDIVNEPEAFRIDRPADNYMFFGHGLHTCFGQYINQVQIPAIAKRILRLKGLRRGSENNGQIRYEASFPDSFVVEFDK